MKQTMRIIFTLGFALVVASCLRNTGAKFVRQADQELALGQTTYQQLIQRLGKPLKEGVEVRNSCQLKNIAYAYTREMGGTPLNEGAILMRIQAFNFFQDKLVGYNYISTYKDDHTDFDNTKISEIKKGSTTKEDVIRLFGNPGGKLIYPAIPDKDGLGFKYSYSQIVQTYYQGTMTYGKDLLVTFSV
jgi:hypothetical protein